MEIGVSPASQLVHAECRATSKKRGGEASFIACSECSSSPVEAWCPTPEIQNPGRHSRVHFRCWDAGPMTREFPVLPRLEKKGSAKDWPWGIIVNQFP
jgi:hypothetical protein